MKLEAALHNSSLQMSPFLARKSTLNQNKVQAGILKQCGHYVGASRSNGCRDRKEGCPEETEQIWPVGKERHMRQNKYIPFTSFYSEECGCAEDTCTQLCYRHITVSFPGLYLHRDGSHGGQVLGSVTAHGLMESSENSLGWRGPQSPSSPNPCHGQDCHPPAQAAQGPIQPGLERLQGWSTTASLGSLC